MMDYTDTPLHMKEILFVKVNHCSDADIAERFRISKVFGVSIIDYDGAAVLLECTQTEKEISEILLHPVKTSQISFSCNWGEISSFFNRTSLTKTCFPKCSTPGIHT